MARTWHIANGHLATGEKDGGHVATLLRLEEARSRSLSHTQREVLDQLEHAAMPFLERTSTGAAGLVVTPSGRRRFGFILTPNELLLIDDGDVCATALGRAVENRARVEGAAGALCALLRELLRDHPARLSRMREDFELMEQQVLEGREHPDRRKMMADSRRMLGLDTFYQGMSDLAGELAEDDSFRPCDACGRRAAPLARTPPEPARHASGVAARLQPAGSQPLPGVHRRAAEQRHAVAHGGDHDRDAAHLCHP